MEGYLGEFEIEKDCEYNFYTKEQFVLMYIERYSSIDGAHHKDWLIDQIARILNNVKVIITKAKWNNGEEEYRFRLGEPTLQYLEWVKEVKSGEDGENTYEYDFGIAP